MQSIYIPNLLNMSGKQIVVEIDDHLSELETLTPIKGRVQVEHHGNFLDVKAIAETIVTLVCDRCLQQYNHRLMIEPSELIWLDDRVDEEEPEAEVEVPMEELVETLPPKGYFNPGEWLYEQLCLAVPQRQLCDQSCAGIAFKNPTDDDSSRSSKPVDQRWALLQDVLKGDSLN